MGNEAAAGDEAAAARPDLFVPTRRVLIVLEIGDDPNDPMPDDMLCFALDQALPDDFGTHTYVIASDYWVDGRPTPPRVAGF